MDRPSLFLLLLFSLVLDMQSILKVEPPTKLVLCDEFSCGGSGSQFIIDGFTLDRRCLAAEWTAQKCPIFKICITYWHRTLKFLQLPGTASTLHVQKQVNLWSHSSQDLQSFLQSNQKLKILVCWIQKRCWLTNDLLFYEKLRAEKGFSCCRFLLPAGCFAANSAYFGRLIAEMSVELNKPITRRLHSHVIL